MPRQLQQGNAERFVVENTIFTPVPHGDQRFLQYLYNCNVQVYNRPRSIYQYSNMATRLSGTNCKFFNFLLSLNSQKGLAYKEYNINIEVCPESLGAISEY